jgi:glycosyltransferase involved in cell wall biosynthesis/phosphoheptose isomerase
VKVALVSEHASPLAPLGGVDAGGQNVHIAALAATLARRGAEVVIHTRRDHPELPEYVAMAPRVRVHHVDAGPAHALPKDELWPHMDEFASHLHSAWRRARPDVIHAHFWMSGYAALEAGQRLELPVIQTFHALGVVKRRYQGEHDTSPPDRIDVEREILRRAVKVIATCTDEVFELVRMGASSSRVTVIPSGVDLRLFAPQGEVAPRTGGVHRLVCVGRLVQRKGIGNVISALAHLPGVELLVAGGPERAALANDPEARRLHQLARETGVGDRVTLLGRVAREQLPALLRSADVLVSVPWYEPFGITPLEAMACGVPVVASAVGGLIDTVVDGRTGVHVPPRDPERLAAELHRLLDDPGRRARYGRAGVKRARRLYDWDRLAAATLDTYARVAHPRRPRLQRAALGAYVLPGDGAEHLASLRAGLGRLEQECGHLEQLGERLALRLLAGGRLLALGNGGSAAQAQHLTAELVGRYQCERRPLSAICLHGDTSSLTAIANDYGAQQCFARQVAAHGRPGDILLAISTSGTSDNVLAAARAGAEVGMEVWALTGPGSTPLARLADETIAMPGSSTATVQELHMIALHVVCAAVDREVALRGERRGEELRGERRGEELRGERRVEELPGERRGEELPAYA